MRPETAYIIPRALEFSEIPDIIEAYRKGAENAKNAGFDGVEIHGANGYLLDQFLQDSTNLRTDKYGGPIENRARLMLEVTDAVVSVWGANRVGMQAFGGVYIVNEGFTRADGTLLRDSTAATLVALRCSGVRRYLVVSQGLLFPSRNPVIGLLRWFLADTVADSIEMEHVVRASASNGPSSEPLASKKVGHHAAIASV